ncbi:MAG: winged helix DNA-binding domain-containing protein [Candidatus Eremiobacteraeota bacterium]|nr:winged helix DNA-binding domain-containing protein [Candidatus Eremiobacteraeota bacterium]
MVSISIGEARRLALAAQGFYDGQPRSITRASLARVLERVKILQIDSVNVLVRSNYLPLYSRLGAYPLELLDEMAYGSSATRTLFEYWAHEASLIPLSMQPLFRWRMDRASRRIALGPRTLELVRTKPRFIKTIERRIQDNGPMTASLFENGRGSGSWWGWSDVKTALEFLFRAGRLSTATRTKTFERVYDITSRVLPDSVLDAPTPSEADAQRELVRIAISALAVATERDIRDYFRLDAPDTRRALLDLLDSGDIVPANVEGWKNVAYMAAGTRNPVGGHKRTTFLSPFDSLIWERDRMHRLFEFHYRIEIYTPAHKRVHGYYVLPILHGHRLIGRIDLKADRPNRTLLIQRLSLERKASTLKAQSLIERQLRSLSSWLGLQAIKNYQ